MKTIIETETGLSKYLLEDDEIVVFKSDHIVLGKPPILIIYDLHLSNAMLIENATAPNDWEANKYSFDGTDWIRNPAWVEHRMPA